MSALAGASVPKVGDPVAAIDTPALVIDLDAMERNLAAMADFARARNVRLRPHAKMHKCAAIARLQRAAGAVGVCVQKTSEAEALAAAGVDDIYISNEVIDRAKLARVARLATRGAAGDRRRLDRGHRAAGGGGARGRLERSTCSSKSTSATVAAARRPPPPARSPIASSRMRRPTAACASPACRRITVRRNTCAAPRSGRRPRAMRPRSRARPGPAITAAGIACPLITGAGTGTFAFDTASGVWGELQAGSYLFMDRDYADNAPAPNTPRFEHALFVKSQVMSRGASHAVVDAGHKSHAIDSGLPRVWRRELVYANGGDEHGLLRLPAGGVPADLPQLGETVWLVPGHCDPTVNLHERYVAVRGGLDAGVVEAVWAIEARGCVG